ncbi:MAG: DUF3619 family protein [Pseudomonadota bacterium]
MKPSEREKAFFEKARAVLDEDADQLDPEIKTRRCRERLAALSVLSSPRRGNSTRIKGWAIMVTVAASVAIIVINLTMAPPVQEPVAESLLVDVDLLSSAGPIEFYEDMDFYRWLAEATENAK